MITSLDVERWVDALIDVAEQFLVNFYKDDLETASANAEDIAVLSEGLLRYCMQEGALPMKPKGLL
jgi:hypothetical protein